MGSLTNKLVAAIVRTNLTETQLLSAIETAESQTDAPPREKRKYRTREMRAAN